jgi:hypothetical protein
MEDYKPKGMQFAASMLVAAVLYGGLAVAVIGGFVYLYRNWTRAVEAKQPTVAVEYQRFVPINEHTMLGVPWTGAFALDTKTGQLCQTFPLSQKSPEWATNLPSCFELYRASGIEASRKDSPQCAPGKVKTAYQYLWCSGLEE